jgi:hypothetical protein
MKVFVYFNLHKKCWSIKALEGENKNRVIGHKTQLTLLDAKFKVSQAGRNRVLKERRKNVHAGVVGYLTEFNDATLNIKVSYNPYKFNHFYNIENNNKVEVSRMVNFNNKFVSAIDS